jgi:hypothetical protein
MSVQIRAAQFGALFLHLSNGVLDLFQMLHNMTAVLRQFHGPRGCVHAVVVPIAILVAPSTRSSLGDFSNIGVHFGLDEIRHFATATVLGASFRAVARLAIGVVAVVQ